jgi:hypothetical protein
MREGTPTVVTRANPALVNTLARAFRYQRPLDEGRYASISEMAAAEQIQRGFLGTPLRVTLLAPEIVAAVLDGRLLASWDRRGCEGRFELVGQNNGKLC